MAGCVKIKWVRCSERGALALVVPHKYLTLACTGKIRKMQRLGSVVIAMAERWQMGQWGKSHRQVGQ